jgi:antitoxin component YwqK of YwqJK toxin-antitoxin module
VNRPSDNPPRVTPRELAIPTGLACALGLVLWVTWRPAPPPPATPLLELSRTNLCRLHGSWYQTGHTNPFTGVLLEFYPGGRPMSRSVISNGLLNGLSQGWFTNGQLQIKETYHDNFSDGLRTKWYPNGQKLSEATIVHGQIEGLFRHWHIDGSLAEEIPMHDGHQEGIGRAYYPSGYLAEEVEVRDGRVIRKITYKPGERKGL